MRIYTSICTYRHMYMHVNICTSMMYTQHVHYAYNMYSNMVRQVCQWADRPHNQAIDNLPLCAGDVCPGGRSLVALLDTVITS